MIHSTATKRQTTTKKKGTHRKSRRSLLHTEHPPAKKCSAHRTLSFTGWYPSMGLKDMWRLAVVVMKNKLTAVDWT
jgi:hypothetical protein